MIVCYVISGLNGVQRLNANLFTTFLWIACAFPGALALLAGALAALFGLLSNQRQLKLDTNLNRKKVIQLGCAVFALGLAWSIVSVLLWQASRPGG